MPSRLPANWASVQLGAIAELLNGRAFRPSDRSATGLPIIRIQNLRDPAAPYNYFNGDVDERHRVSNGDLLFAWSGTPGTSFGAHIWSGGPAVLNQHIFRVDFNRSLLHPRFLQTAINLQLPQLIKQAKGGAGLKHLSKSTVESVPVPVPPLQEQERIVATLDATSGKVALIRAEIEALSNVANRLQNAVLAWATAGNSSGLPPDFDAKDLPPGWRSARVGDIGEVILGRMRSPQHHDGPNMRPYLRVANVLEDRIDVSDVMEMNFTDEEFERYQLRLGDILLNEGQSLNLVGRPAMFRGEIDGACFTNTLVRFRAGATVAPEFALLVFRHFLRSGRFKKIAKITTNLAHLSLGRFAELMVPVPPLEEQVEIAGRSRAALSAVAAAVAQMERVRVEARRLTIEIEKVALSGRASQQRLDVEPLPNIELIRGRADSEQQKRSSARTSKNRTRDRLPKLTEPIKMTRIIPVSEVLADARKPLAAPVLFTSAGYPDDASVAQVEQFYVDLREALRSGKITKHRIGNDDVFRLAPGTER